MTNLEWLASMSKEGARDTMANCCPFRRPVDGRCDMCPLAHASECADITYALEKMEAWLLEEHKPEEGD